MRLKIIAIISLLTNIILIAIFLYFFFPVEKQVKKNANTKWVKKSPSVSFRKPFSQKHIEKLDSLIDSGSVIIVDSTGKTLLDYHSNTPLIPASTLKLITSLTAIHHLGANYRFITEFKVDQQKNLYIKGYGDPSLTSDEIRIIIKELAKKNLKKINSIFVDGSYFSDFILVPGNENTYEAYDAKNSALAANYNTISFKREKFNRRSRRNKLTKKGKRSKKNNWNKRNIKSGEKETPFVEYSTRILEKAEKEKKSLKYQKYIRISIKEEKDSLLYFGHLFKALCKEESIKVKGKVMIKKAPKELKNFYKHKSSKSLSEIIKDLMEFSNNFTANQILLTLGALKGKPAKLESGIEVVSSFLKKSLKIKIISLKEGSGLSYGNKVTAKQMVEVVKHFKKYKHLLKKFGPNIYAKSGGLKTTFSLVGFMDSPLYGEVRFAIILNQSSNNKPHILKMLIDTLDL